MIDNNSIINFIISKFQNINYAALAPQIRELLITSINRNFQVGGRYGNDNPFGGGNTKWIKSKRAIRQSGMTLLDTGQMAASIRVQVKFEGNQLIIQMGSNKEYASQHQFGYTKSNKVKIPARPFLVIQNEDIANIRNMIVKNIIGKF